MQAHHIQLSLYKQYAYNEIFERPFIGQTLGQYIHVQSLTPNNYAYSTVPTKAIVWSSFRSSCIMCFYESDRSVFWCR